MAKVSVNEKQGVPESSANRNHKAVSAFDEAHTLIRHAQSVLECVSVAARSDEGINGDSADGACTTAYSMLEKINAHMETLFSEWQKRAVQA